MEIDCNGTVNEYVAAQGPLSDTCADFWQVRLVYFTMLLHIYTYTLVSDWLLEIPVL